jgi:hypothetical protein
MAAGFVGYGEGGLRAAFVFSRAEISAKNFSSENSRIGTDAAT